MRHTNAISGLVHFNPCCICLQHALKENQALYVYIPGGKCIHYFNLFMHIKCFLRFKPMLTNSLTTIISWNQILVSTHNLDRWPCSLPLSLGLFQFVFEYQQLFVQWQLLTLRVMELLPQVLQLCSVAGITSHQLFLIEQHLLIQLWLQLSEFLLSLWTGTWGTTRSLLDLRKKQSKWEISWDSRDLHIYLSY